MTATQLITGTVAGFVLVIDPNNEKGKRERIEYSDATLLSARLSQLRRADTAFYKANPQLNYDPTEENFCTLYRREDNGEMEQEDSFDPSGDTKVGDVAHKAQCKCGKTSWSKTRTGQYESKPSGEYTCAECSETQHRNDYQCGDFTNYDGMQEREY